jgi:hypothetical protein
MAASLAHYLEGNKHRQAIYNKNKIMILKKVF